MTAWSDIHRSDPVVVTLPAYEPVSRAEAKRHLQIEVDDEDAWFDRMIPVARAQVEADTNQAFVRTVLEVAFDAFPDARWFPLPRPPLVSVTSVTSIDDDGVETAMDVSDYLVDTSSRPGRVILAPGVSWPTDVRAYLGGKVRWTAGFSGVAKAVTSVTRAGATATVTTPAAHGYNTGQWITVAGADQEGYNGTFTITVTGATTFTYTVIGTPATPATGVVTVASSGVPERYVQAILLLLWHWHEYPGAVDPDGRAAAVPLGYDALISDRLIGVG